MSEKLRVRVKAGSSSAPEVRPVAMPDRPRMRSAYMRDSKSGVIAARPASLREHRDEVRRIYTRAAGLAMDMLQNSGRLRGAADQILADTVGVELQLNPKPQVESLGYSQEEITALARIMKQHWKVHSWNPLEYDFRAKATSAQHVDIGLRNWMAFGESTGICIYVPKAQRLPGAVTGWKFLLTSPNKLTQDTNEVEGLYQGVIHDAFGRPVGYRFEEKRDGLTQKITYAARDAAGRQLVMHAFDPFSAEDVRGLSLLVPNFRKYLMAENVDDANAEIRFLQTVYSAILKSDKPSAEAFEAFETLAESKAEGASDLQQDFIDYFKSQLDRAAESEIRMGPGAGVSHLAPGEDFEFKNITAPGPDNAEFMASLHRETARGLGMSYGGYTLDYTKATYASTNMENAAIWPVTRRRTDRIAAPHVLVPYGNVIDEAVEEGIIPIKGGIEVYRANRERFLYAVCNGPAKPTADDEKRARAASERIANGTGDIEVEISELGNDPQEVAESRLRWHEWYKANGMPSPFERGQASKPATAAQDNQNQQGAA